MKKYSISLVLIFILSSGFSQNLSDSLKLYYPFNGNALDHSGNGNDGVVVNATLTRNRFGIESTAYEFDGYNDYILTNSTFDFVNRSISLWVQTYNINGHTPDNHIVITQDDFRLKNGLLRVGFDDGDFNLWAGGAGNSYKDDGFSFLDEWTHVVLVRDSSSVYYYIDSELVMTEYANNIASTYDPDSNLVIGAGRSHLQFFNGKIDDIRIYNRVLSQKEIKDLFNNDITVTINEVSVTNNPYSDHFTINCNFNGDYTVRLIDVSGRVLQTEKASGDSYKFLKNGLVTGMYFLQVIESNKIHLTKKIIVN